jgi:hypothetical protein
MKVIRLIDDLGGFVESYDPDFMNGRGLIVRTRNIDKAKKFENHVEAQQEWARISATNPTRPDGRPNRPMSAITVMIIDEEDHQHG